jgi:hypothetical protein
MQIKQKTEIGDLVSRYTSGSLSEKTFKERISKITKSAKLKIDIDAVISDLNKERKVGTSYDWDWVQ